MSRQTEMVDVNSRISIDVDRDALTASLAALGSGARTAALVKDYVQFQRAVTELTAALLPLQEALLRRGRVKVAADGAAAKSAVDQALTAMRPPALALLDYATESAVDDPAAQARRSRFRAALNDALARTRRLAAHLQLEAIEPAARDELARLRRDLGDALAQEGIKIMMGAWIATAAGTTPVHLGGFDDYEDQARYEVDRFSLVLTDEQKQQYQKAQELAAGVDGRQGGDLAKQIALDFVQRNFAEPLAELKDLEEACLRLAAAAPSGASTIAASVTAFLNKLADQRGWIERTVADLRQIGLAHPEELARRLAAAVQEATPRVSQLGADLTTLRNSLTGVAGGLAPLASAVVQSIDRTRADLTKDLASDWQQVQVVLTGRQLNADTLAFGAQVRQLDLDAVPARTDLDLELSGKRADGDHVVIKIGAARAQAKAIDLETRHLVLRRILLHVETAVGLIFATRPKMANETKAGLQAAPSYAAFLKKGFRGCSFWNNVLTPGIGINVAALDFNLDGSPEMGVGAAVALLRDWLQGGVGYNLFERQWYGFIGVGLPLPTFGVSFSKGAATAP